MVIQGRHISTEEIALIRGLMAENPDWGRTRLSQEQPISQELVQQQQTTIRRRLRKPAPKSLRKKSGRKPGGQPGHAGHTLKMTDKPDHVEAHRVNECEHCGRSLADQRADGIEKRQIHDLPPLRLIVTEHQSETKTCCCGHVNKAAFPAGINAPAQYGERIKAAAVYLKNYQLLPYARTCELMGDFFGSRLTWIIHEKTAKHIQTVDVQR